MTKDPDMTDDWMNPTNLFAWTIPTPENKMIYAIQRAKKTICFGNPGHIVEWKEWSKHDTAEARNAELAKLEEEHPMWRLRKRDYNPYLESIGMCGND